MDNKEQLMWLMRSAITVTNGKPDEVFPMFEVELLEMRDARLVWDLFEQVRDMTLRRLYGMAKWQIENENSGVPSAQQHSDAHADLQQQDAPEPENEADDRSPGATFTQRPPQHSSASSIAKYPREVVFRHPGNHNRRSAQSAISVVQTVGGRKSYLDTITNNRGTPVGDMTYEGLQNANDESPIFREYASLLMGAGLPRTGKMDDTVRKYITPDEGDRMWLMVINKQRGDAA